MSDSEVFASFMASDETEDDVKKGKASSESQTSPLLPPALTSTSITTTATSSAVGVTASGTGSGSEESNKNKAEMIVGGKYRVLHKIGGGSFGDIHLGVDTINGEEVAIKLEKISNNPLLHWEYKVYQQLLESGHTAHGIPHAFWFGSVPNFQKNALVLDLLGPSLDDLLWLCGKRFSVKTVLLLADQMINRLDFLHRQGYLHRDMKPENFVMGIGRHANKVYLVDFGLAKKYRDHRGHHINDNGGVPLNGTVRYATLNAHYGRHPSRRDDMESLGLIFMYFLRGDLPWQGKAGDRRGYSKTQYYDKIKKLKEQVSINKLCETFPAEFAQYLDHCRNLSFKAKPDYLYLRQIFRNLGKTLGYKYNFEFDWSLVKNKTEVEWRQQLEAAKKANAEAAEDGGAGDAPVEWSD